MGNDARLQEVFEELRQMPLFDGIPNESLLGAITQGAVVRQVLERDRFVSDPEHVRNLGPRVYFIAAGHLAAAIFDNEVVTSRRAEQDRVDRMSDAERKELSLLQPPPLAREAKKNLAAFMSGDLFNSAALATHQADGNDASAIYTVGPSIIISLSHESVAALAVKYSFFEAKLRRAVEVSRDRLRHIAGVKQEILDFFVRHGISVAGHMVRVRQLDSCIDCKLCEIACEERYGAKRLTLGGYQLGMLDFVFTCRTCTDQRCIDPCEYDSIKFDADIQEVVINESSCVGCTLCAQACPYDAIEMLDVEDPKNPNHHPKFKKRLEKEGSLKFGSGSGRVARARRIANKCDHCMNFGDQACVSACPTGSLIEVSPLDLFRERTPAAVAMARSGFDHDMRLDHSEILPTAPFTQGVGVRDAGMAKVRRGRIGPVIMWGVALAAWFLALAEILLRMYKPSSALQYVILRAEGLEAEVAIQRVGFRAGADLAINMGWVGTVLLFIAAIYPFMRRIPSFRRIASNTMWFDFHMMAGTMGPFFILLHSAIKLDNIWAAPFWAMWFVVLSGVVGRYLYTQVPDLLNGRELEELDHERAFKRYRSQFPQAMHLADQLIGERREKAMRVAKEAGIFTSTIWIILEDLRRPARYFKRRNMMRSTGIPAKIWKDIASRTGRLLLFERRRVLVPRARMVLHTWKIVHVIFTILLTAGSVWHIWATWDVAMDAWPISILFGSG